MTVISTGDFMAELKAIVKNCVKEEIQIIAPQISKPDICDIDVAEEITGLKRSSIYVKVSKRSIPHMKQNGRLYFSRKELEEYIRKGKRETLTGIDSIVDKQLLTKKTA